MPNRSASLRRSRNRLLLVISIPHLASCWTKNAIWREGDRLFLKALAKDIIPTAIAIYPESETNFFLKVNDEQLTFIKNHEGEVTTLIHHLTGLPDCEGKKVPVSTK